MNLNSLAVGDTILAALNVSHLPKLAPVLWTVTRVNRSSYSVHYRVAGITLNLYLDKRTGKIRR